MLSQLRTLRILLPTNTQGEILASGKSFQTSFHEDAIILCIFQVQNNSMIVI
jgi:hypothetical protein